MKAARLIPIGLAAAVTCAAALLVPAGASAGSSSHLYRWDIIHLSGPPPVTTTLPGGAASACAASSCANMITLTGSGTFRSNPGGPQDVTGGGTWTTAGFGAGSGTYKVTGFVSFVLAPGNLPSPPFTDGITGVAADARAGLAVLRSGRGCARGPGGAPDCLLGWRRGSPGRQLRPTGHASQPAHSRGGHRLQGLRRLLEPGSARKRGAVWQPHGVPRSRLANQTRERARPQPVALENGIRQVTCGSSGR